MRPPFDPRPIAGLDAAVLAPANLAITYLSILPLLAVGEHFPGKQFRLALRRSVEERLRSWDGLSVEFGAT